MWIHSEEFWRQFIWAYVLRVSVQFLSKQFDKINEFGTVLKQCNYLDNGSCVIWDYRLIVLNPQANPSSVSNQQKAKNWFSEQCFQFIYWQQRIHRFCCVHGVHPDDCCLQKSIETNTTQKVVFSIRCLRQFHGIGHSLLLSWNWSGGWYGVSNVDGSCADLPRYASWSWQLAMLGNWLLHDCHYYQASGNGIAPSQRQNQNKGGSWRC